MRPTTESVIGNHPLRPGVSFFFAVAIASSSLRAAELPVSPTVAAARQLVQRVVPKQAKHFAIETIPTDNGRDAFEVETLGDQIVLRGNDAVSIASALNWYLKNECHCDLSWNCGDQLAVPKPLPPVPGKVHIVSPHRFRYAYNFCTYGYTMAWWDWPRWEHELDFLAMSGINLALAIEGQESVWIQAFKPFGYSDADTCDWVVAPSHQPWMYMDNMENYGGPLSPKLVARRLELGQRIVARMRELGIQPVLPGYYGMVPADFRKKYPTANVHAQGQWARLKRPDILDPTDPIFAKVARAFYDAQNDLFGGAQFYDADPFHEGGTTEGIRVAAAGRAIQEAMNGATWVLQSWQANPRQEMVDALNKDKVLVLDLYCEDHENWRLRTNFNGAPWIWCAINNFGGNTRLDGRLAWMASGPVNALNDPAKGRMSGIGAIMEATGGTPALWEMLLENAWRSTKPDLDTWLSDYALRRYGAKIPAAEKAWKILAETAYAAPPPSSEHTSKSAICSRPALGNPSQERPVTSPQYDPTRLVEAWRLLLEAAPEARSSDGYRFDLCDVGRQVLADLGTSYNPQIIAAFRGGDATKLRALSDKMLGLIQDLDTLVGTRREFLLGAWLSDARSWGSTKTERDLCERNARELLTVWTSLDNITDYANREWNGLVGDFYFHRWEMWLDALNRGVSNVASFSESATRASIRDWELGWTRRTDGHYATGPHGDVVAISQRLFAKYSAEVCPPAGTAAVLTH